VKISIIGSRGLPATYGGFETLAHYLSLGLIKKGYEVIVSCKYKNKDERIEDYKGVKLFYPPINSPRSHFQYFYEVFSDIYFLCTLSFKSDVIYLLGTGVGSFSFIPKLFNRSKVVANIAGLEYQRDKYNRLQKSIIKLNTILLTLFADVIIVDSKALTKYINPHFQKKTVYISYGASETEDIRWDDKKLQTILLNEREKENDIVQNKYWLVVARLQQDNNIHTIIEGFLNSDSTMKLVIVGEYSSKKYKKNIDKLLNKDTESKILMIGGVYDRDLLIMLRKYCFGHIHGHSVGGTNPSLLEAMMMKNLIIAHENEFNREVGGQTVLYFKDSSELTNLINSIEKDPSKYSALRQNTYSRVKSLYNWDEVTEEYENLFKSMIRG
jgi:rhamnosyltransferase